MRGGDETVTLGGGQENTDKRWQGDDGEVAYVSCGAEYCFDKVTGVNTSTVISHASAAHKPQWFYLYGDRVFNLKK